MQRVGISRSSKRDQQAHVNDNRECNGSRLKAFIYGEEMMPGIAPAMTHAHSEMSKQVGACERNCRVSAKFYPAFW